MAQRNPVQKGGVESTETTQAQIGETAGDTQTARKILDKCVGHHNESLRDAGGTIVEVDAAPMRVFDVAVYVEFSETPRVVHSKQLGALGIDTLEFHDIIPREDGGRVTTFAAEHDDTVYGLNIVVSGDEETPENRGDSE